MAINPGLNLSHSRCFIMFRLLGTYFLHQSSKFLVPSVIPTDPGDLDSKIEIGPNKSPNRNKEALEVSV